MGTDRIRPTLFIPRRGIERRNTDESYQDNSESGRNEELHNGDMEEGVKRGAKEGKSKWMGKSEGRLTIVVRTLLDGACSPCSPCPAPSSLHSPAALTPHHPDHQSNT